MADVVKVLKHKHQTEQRIVYSTQSQAKTQENLQCFMVTLNDPCPTGQIEHATGSTKGEVEPSMFL